MLVTNTPWSEWVGKSLAVNRVKEYLMLKLLICTTDLTNILVAILNVFIALAFTALICSFRIGEKWYICLNCTKNIAIKFQYRYPTFIHNRCAFLILTMYEEVKNCNDSANSLILIDLSRNIMWKYGEYLIMTSLH